MISVCIATYQGEKYIREQRASIRCQRADDDEIIVSDDGSTDRTLDIIRQMAAFRGHVVIQTLFMHGTMAGADVTNTTPYYIEPWLAALRRIAPQEVMIYTIDRPTPDTTLQKATPAELDAIRQQVEALGITCTASY